MNHSSPFGNSSPSPFLLSNSWLWRWMVPVMSNERMLAYHVLRCSAWLRRLPRWCRRLRLLLFLRYLKQIKSLPSGIWGVSTFYRLLPFSTMNIMPRSRHNPPMYCI
ncbi:hypothetical protein BO71DRAFT_171378 [Aspergillus ellipticus CBS 707.79]|uniref:Uncharacterized protein n=1 Tax=Aspergillus ellipticus CBS 707.79 TaxID=1448320 RepID=A0A319DQ03_9EURO|nr:hypothetical protein BO71DRAFT_171378 [Aspergillus ellipticus CBS 707.79]